MVERPVFFFKRGIPPSPDAIGKLNRRACLFRKHDLRTPAVQKSRDPFINTRLRHGGLPCYDILTGAGACRRFPLQNPEKENSPDTRHIKRGCGVRSPEAFQVRRSRRFSRPPLTGGRKADGRRIMSVYYNKKGEIFQGNVLEKFFLCSRGCSRGEGLTPA